MKRVQVQAIKQSRNSRDYSDDNDSRTKYRPAKQRERCWHGERYGECPHFHKR